MIPNVISTTPLVEVGIAVAPLAFLIGLKAWPARMTFTFRLSVKEAKRRAGSLRCVCGHIFLKHGRDNCYGAMPYTAGRGMCSCPIFEPDRFWDVMRYFHLRLRTGSQEIV